MNDLLPVKETIMHTFAKPLAIWNRLLVAITWPVLVALVIHLIQVIVDDMHSLISFFLALIDQLLYVVIAVTCHRLILIGTDSMPAYGLDGWSMRETRFTCWMFAISLLGFVFAIPAGILFARVEDTVLNYWLSIPILILALLPYAIICAKLSPILPRIAIDKAVSLKWAWELTRGNGIRLVFVTLIIPIIIIFPLAIFIYYMTIAYYETGMMVLVEVIVTLVGYLLTIFIVSSLSVSYQWLIENRQDY
jgi:hypothetical protein